MVMTFFCNNEVLNNFILRIEKQCSENYFIAFEIKK